MQQLQRTQQEMDVLFSKLKDEKIPRILIDTMSDIAEKSHVIADIIGKMNPADVKTEEKKGT